MIQLLRHKIDVHRPSPSKGTSGGEKQTDSTPYTGLPCLVQPVTATWLAQYQRRSIDVTHTVFFAPRTAGGSFSSAFSSAFDVGGTTPIIANGDWLMFNGRKLLIKGVRDLQEWGRVLAVDALEVS